MTQIRGTFPALNAGLKKLNSGVAKAPAKRKPIEPLTKATGGFAGFKVGRRLSAKTSAPSSFAGRRALSRKGASGG